MLVGGNGGEYLSSGLFISERERTCAVRADDVSENADVTNQLLARAGDVERDNESAGDGWVAAMYVPMSISLRASDMR